MLGQSGPGPNLIHIQKMTHTVICAASHSGVNNAKINRSVLLIGRDGGFSRTAHNRWVYEMNKGGKNKIYTKPPQAASDPQ